MGAECFKQLSDDEVVRQLFSYYLYTQVVYLLSWQATTEKNNCQLQDGLIRFSQRNLDLSAPYVISLVVHRSKVLES